MKIKDNIYEKTWVDIYYDDGITNRVEVRESFTPSKFKRLLEKVGRKEDEITKVERWYEAETASNIIIRYCKSLYTREDIEKLK